VKAASDHADLRDVESGVRELFDGRIGEVVRSEDGDGGGIGARPRFPRIPAIESPERETI
jgi:hypothetical protein